MNFNSKIIFSWICILLVLVAGPMQAHGLVLCSGCVDGSGIEFSEPDGSCSSCPHEDSNKHEDRTSNHDCTCIDQPLPSHELILQHGKIHLEKIYVALPILQSVLQVISESHPSQIPDYLDYPPGSITLKRSVVLLI